MNNQTGHKSSGKRSRDKKVVPFNLRVAESEKASFETAASLAGVSLSAWVRERLRAAAIRELESAGLRIEFLNEIQD